MVCPVSGLRCMKTGLLCHVSGEMCRCMSRYSAHTEAVPPPIASIPVIWVPLCRALPASYRPPLCFKYRIARTPPPSVFAGYWKRPLSGSWGPAAFGEQWSCRSRSMYHLSVFILINNSHSSEWWYSCNRLFCFEKKNTLKQAAKDE